MSDLISRAWVLAEYDRQHQGPPGGARKIMEEAPAVDAVPVVHGEWTTKRTRRHDGEWYCSVCEYEPIVFIVSNYCPNCGAIMDGDA